MQPHVQVKLLEFDAHIFSYEIAKSIDQKLTALRRLLRSGHELKEMAEFVKNNDDLEIILNAILRADAALNEDIRRLGI